MGRRLFGKAARKTELADWLTNHPLDPCKFIGVAKGASNSRF